MVDSIAFPPKKKIENRQIKKLSRETGWQYCLPPLAASTSWAQDRSSSWTTILGWFYIIHYSMLWWMHWMWSKTIDEKPRWTFFVGPFPLGQVYKWKVCLFFLFVITSRFPISRPFISSQDQVRPHISYILGNGMLWSIILAMTKTHTKTKHVQVPPIEDQLMLGVSHVIEYIRTGKNNFIFVFKDV